VVDEDNEDEDAIENFTSKKKQKYLALEGPC
jgi:hypothetical protein